MKRLVFTFVRGDNQRYSRRFSDVRYHSAAPITKLTLACFSNNRSSLKILTEYIYLQRRRWHLPSKDLSGLHVDSLAQELGSCGLVLSDQSSERNFADVSCVPRGYLSTCHQLHHIMSNNNFNRDYAHTFLTSRFAFRALQRSTCNRSILFS